MSDEAWRGNAPLGLDDEHIARMRKHFGVERMQEINEHLNAAGAAARERVLAEAKANFKAKLLADVNAAVAKAIRTALNLEMRREGLEEFEELP